MKNIIKGKDDLYYSINITDSEGQILIPSDLHAFTMQFFTQNNNGQYVEYDASDLVDNVLRINAQDLTELVDGPLKVRFLISIADENYADGSYDITAERLTGYFLKTVKTKQTPHEEPVDSSINENNTEGGEV